MALSSHNILLLLSSVLIFSACTTDNSENIEESSETISVDIKNRTLVNKAANIPSQCYTKTEDDNGVIHNPCFNCHISAKIPNYVDDWDFQEIYPFREYTLENHWTNLFKDRTQEISKIDDVSILNYIRENNYIGADGKLLLAEKLNNLSEEWDIDSDGKWDGYIPDCYFNFDNEGFDKNLDNEYTGWRAFGYYPFLGTFWPTNGSTDDVLIRLPEVFRENNDGQFDLDTYKVNLLIVESLIKQKDIKTDPIDESKYDVDLDKDGKIGIAYQITFEYDPINGKNMSYVGNASKQNEMIAAGLYPVGTEFLHTVRYLDIDNNNSVKMSARLKELRYGKKVSWFSYSDHKLVYDQEMQDLRAFPDRLAVFIGDAERGLSNNRGWRYQGFIEDQKGELRPQTYEENLNCIGCHSSLGALADSTFVFQRKFENDTFQNGWFHWSQKGFEGIAEPKTPDGRDEYVLYLQENGAGDEFRSNSEIKEKFFDENGSLITDEVKNFIPTYRIYFCPLHKEL